MPPGVFINEDPPEHTMHRALVSRAFTPGRMRKLEDQIRAFCAACLDPLEGDDRFDFVLDLGAQMPVKAIGMLMGIPEADQPSVRDAAVRKLRNKPGEPLQVTKERYFSGRAYAEYVAWRAREPVRRPRHRAAERRVRRPRRRAPQALPGGAAHLHRRDRRRRRRDHRPAVRLDGQGPRRAPRPAGRGREGPLAGRRTRSRSCSASSRPGPTSPATSPRTSSTTARSSRPAAPCC